MAAKKKGSRKRHGGSRRQMVAQDRERGQKRESSSDTTASRPTISARVSASAGVGDEILMDMRPLLDGSEGMTRVLVGALLGEETLADEPELQDVFFDPLAAARTFAAMSDATGLDPDAVDELPAEGFEAIRADIMERSVLRLLTPEIRQEILDRLNDLRLRLRQEGTREETARVAALQAFLGEQPEPAAWATTALAHAIFERSLAVGLEIVQAIEEAGGPSGAGEDLLAVGQQMARSGAADRTDELLETVPGLEDFATRRVNEVWDAGISVLKSGELYLGLYSDDELIEALHVFAEAAGYDGEGPSTEASTPATASDERAKIVIERLDQYITELFTPDRLAELQNRLDVLFKDWDGDRRWLAFLALARHYLRSEDAVENEKWFLMVTLFNELSARGEELYGGDEDT